MIGNSRLHWAGFVGENLEVSWDTPHVKSTEVQEWIASIRKPSALHQTWPQAALKWLFGQDQPCLTIYLASVVPGQSQIWSEYPHLYSLKLQDVPLSGIYPTLGLDRALALWGAGQSYGFPQLVIDAGTALTFTGANGKTELVGGAILPGLRTQFQSLASQTAQLPWVKWSDGADALPQRWAMETEAAIASGILHFTLAGIRDFIQDWRNRYPGSSVVLTGGDAEWLWTALNAADSALASTIYVDRQVIFWGIRACRHP